MTYVLAAEGLCRPGPPSPGWVAIDAGVIVEVGSGAAPASARDLGAALLAPGFVDLQVNGVGDVDFDSADPGGWRHAGRAQLEAGVTAYCPTFVTAPLDDYPPALERARAAQADAAHGSLPAITGVHLEGPFLGGAPGAHPVDLVRPAECDWLRALLAEFPGLVRIVTLAPEADPGLAATRLLRDEGVTVALGHSTATFEEARAAADAGARLVTHLFNGMGPLHHREPGLAGAALDDDRLTPTLIPDLVHVHPVVLRLTIRRKHNVALVTDRVATAGLRVTNDGAARLADGTLAGSTLSMDRAVRNTVGLGVPIERAIEMASTIPAGALGLGDRGRIARGMRADLVALDPDSLAVRGVWLAGERAHPSS
ncbi:MAG TPA: amidohydrolase family protein [Acidimicrobiia bacterium]|nr:amidohydrolase family protein [Acidimicrobiia bacterium]